MNMRTPFGKTRRLDKSDRETGIYIGNGVVTTQTHMTDEQLTFAMNDIRKTMKLHEFGSPYHDKLMREYDEILEQMGQNCMREYQKRYGQ